LLALASHASAPGATASVLPDHPPLWSNPTEVTLTVSSVRHSDTLSGYRPFSPLIA
jgi:hypothetical protein